IRSLFYHGRYRSSDLDRIAASADFCIVPSLGDETLGFTGLEMLARGVPILASTRAGVCEFVVPGGNGYIFAPTSSETLVSLIVDILQSRSPAKLRMVRQPLSPSIKVFRDHVGDMK